LVGRFIIFDWRRFRFSRIFFRFNRFLWKCSVYRILWKSCETCWTLVNFLSDLIHFFRNNIELFNEWLISLLIRYLSNYILYAIYYFQSILKWLYFIINLGEHFLNLLDIFSKLVFKLFIKFLMATCSRVLREWISHIMKSIFKFVVHVHLSHLIN